MDTMPVTLAGASALTPEARPTVAPAVAPQPTETFVAGSHEPPPEARPSAVAPAAPPPPPSEFEDPNMISLFPTREEIPEKYRIKPENNPAVWLLDGKVVPYAGETRPVYSRVAVRDGDKLEPVLLGYEAKLTSDDAKLAVAAAQKAWNHHRGEWPTASPETRIAAVERFAREIETKADEIATLLMWEIGKSQSVARKEVDRTIEYIRATVAAYRKRVGEPEYISGKDGNQAHYGAETGQPLGIALSVGPFNYPVNEYWTTIIPALITGNVVIGKNPRFGTLANQVMMHAAANCFPPGVLNMLPGDGRAVLPSIIGAEESNGRGKKGVIDCFSFIGSEGAANALLKQHPTPTTLHGLVLGLGAKNAGVVLPGADLETTATNLVKGALGYNGQRCTAEKIVFVHRSQADRLARLMADKVAAMTIGMPHDNPDSTPLPEADKLEKMRAMLSNAKQHGAQILNPGGGMGTFSLMKPAVVYPVTKAMELYHEEQFGPIIPIVVYDDISEVYDWHANSSFGQQASVWGPPDAAAAVAKELSKWVARTNENLTCKCGPDTFAFTAVGRSGVGVLSIDDALDTYTRGALRVVGDETRLH